MLLLSIQKYFAQIVHFCIDNNTQKGNDEKMWRNSEQALDSIFLSYNKILKRLNSLVITTNMEKKYHI